MLRRIVALAGLVAVAAAAAPAGADELDAAALNAALVRPASRALRGELHRDTAAQSQPVGIEHAPVRAPALPTGFSYTLDVSAASSLGATGKGGGNGLPGGYDAVVSYGFTPRVRVFLGDFTLQEYPKGFSDGSVPVYLQGVAAPIGVTPRSGPGSLSTNDATVVNHVAVASLQTLWMIGHRIPIVISPTYVARSGSIGGHSDVTTVEVNGLPQALPLRTFQQELVGVTLPFLSTPRFFGTYTIAPQWTLHPFGANTDNRAKLFQLLYLEAKAGPRTTLFVQPSLLQNYTPIDYYASHIPTVIAGVTHRVAGPVFVQVQFSGGTPTNPLDRGRLGITSITCQQLPCASASQVAPTIGGLKAQQVQFMLGIGSPSVIPL